MKRIANVLIGIMIMGLVSIICILLLSGLTYMLKWQADIVMLGITITYILAGFFGGIGLKRIPILIEHRKAENVSREQIPEGIGIKMIEGFCAGSGFMLLLIVLSLFLTESGFQISSRLLVIWMLLTGSTALGRIL